MQLLWRELVFCLNNLPSVLKRMKGIKQSNKIKLQESGGIKHKMWSFAKSKETKKIFREGESKDTRLI